MKEEYIKNLSVLTNLSQALLMQIYKLNMLIISDELYEQLYCSNIEVPKLTLSTYGDLRLNINQKENKVEFKFFPSDEFISVIRQTILQKQNLLQTKLESKLVDRIKSNYDDILDGTMPMITNKKKALRLKKEVISQISNLQEITKVKVLEIVSRAFNILAGVDNG